MSNSNTNSNKNNDPASLSSFAAALKNDYDNVYQTKIIPWAEKTLQGGVEKLVSRPDNWTPHAHAPMESYFCELRRLLSDARVRFDPKPAEMLVVSTGSNGDGQLGYIIENDEDEDFHRPDVVAGVSGMAIRQVAAGGAHSMALGSDGVPYTWGINDKGMLGRKFMTIEDFGKRHPEINEDTLKGKYNAAQDNFNKNPAPVTGFVTKDAVLKEDDTLPTEDGTIVQIAAGATFSTFLTSEGNVYTTGFYKDCDSGEFCDVDPRNPSSTAEGFNDKPVHVHLPQPAIHIAAGPSSKINVAVLKDSTLVTWGMGNVGQLARSAKMTNPNPDGTYNIDRSLYMKDQEDPVTKQIEQVVNLDEVRKLFLKPKHVIWAGPSMKRIVLSVSCSVGHMLVAARESSCGHSRLFVSGLNGSGQLGLGSTVKRVDELTPVPSLDEHHITKVAAGDDFSLALNFWGDTLFSFGRSLEGQLGAGPKVVKQGMIFSPQIVLFQYKHTVIVDHIEAGEMFALAVDIEKQVWTWGSGTSGATGHHVVKDILSSDDIKKHDLSSDDLKNLLGDDIHSPYPRLLDLKSILQGKLPMCKDLKVHGAAAGGVHTLVLVKPRSGDGYDSDDDIYMEY